ncbi:MAG: GDP-mannose mannosyl hydrolase [Pseudomonadota bacterium]
MKLPQDIFAFVVRHTPLVSLDFIVRNERNEILLGLRNNRPAQGCWFVPGGRLAKDETREQAFRRLTLDELGTSFSLEQARFLGVYEHLYTDNFSDDPSFGTHYVVLAYELRVRAEQLDLPAEQHGGYLWLDDAAIRNRNDVHPYSRAYCSAA